MLGPTTRDGAIVYDDLESATELPIGWTDRQDAATYRLERRDDEARFGFAVGPHSWKQFLLPARVRLWQARRNGAGELEVEEEALDETPLAFIGVRSCELHAISIQDRVFLEGSYVERDYAARRSDDFVVAVNCFEPGGTCFCVSMGTGPKAEAGYDLALTEILDGEHRLLVEVGTERGADVLGELPRRAAAEPDLAAAAAAVDGAAARMGRQLESGDLRDLLQRNLEHPRWDEVAERCLTCGNCTMVCPTCFCTSVEDTSDLAGESAERVRLWDSCYSVDYSHIHGGAVQADRSVALPAVAHPQVRHLARPVRHVWLRRLRTLHHLVPGRNRRNGGAGRDQSHGRGAWTRLRRSFGARQCSRGCLRTS